MQAVIMAGGKGTRLVSITKDEFPKPMVPILGKPLLEWQIEQLKQNNISEIIIIIGHLGDKIKDYFGNGDKFNIQITYVKENTPLGTAGAFYHLKNLIHNDNFLLVFGDVFFNIDIKKMLEFHNCKNSMATLFVHPNSHPYDSDLVTLDSNSKIQEFNSKNNIRDYWYDNCVNAGFYILNKSVCDLIKEEKRYDLEKDILFKLVEENQPVFGYHSSEYIKDIGTVERIQNTLHDIWLEIPEQKCLKNKQKCIFIDRDGTINQYKGLIYQEKDFVLETGVDEAFKLINKSSWLSIVITNQPVVARGLCSIEDVENVHKKMTTLLGKKGVFIDDILFCPHHPDKGYPEENPDYKIKCECRKPGIGLIEQASKKYNIDLKNSWFIGDTTIDIQTGKNAGMKTALVLTGEKGQDRKYNAQPDLVSENLLEAVRRILEE